MSPEDSLMGSNAQLTQVSSRITALELFGIGVSGVETTTTTTTTTTTIYIHIHTYSKHEKFSRKVSFFLFST
jgi:hypothetical protein